MTPPRKTRRDQLRNRQALLSTAVQVFREHGVQASIEHLADAAGVGTTTFYRHFATKDDLIDAVVDDLAGGALAVVLRAKITSDPWAAFVYVFEHGSVLHQRDMALFVALGQASKRGGEKTARAIAEIVRDVTTRAQEAGVLRADVSVGDVATLMNLVHSLPMGKAHDTAVRIVLAGLGS